MNLLDELIKRIKTIKTIRCESCGTIRTSPDSKKEFTDKLLNHGWEMVANGGDSILVCPKCKQKYYDMYALRNKEDR